MTRINCLFGCMLALVSINCANSFERKRDEIPLAHQTKICTIYKKFVSLSARKNSNLGPFKKHELGNQVMKATLTLASLRNNLSDFCLLSRIDYAIGAAPSEYRHEILLRRGKELLAELKTIEPVFPICDPTQSICLDHKSRVNTLEKRINGSLKIDKNISSVTGEPFSYLGPKELTQEIKSLEKTLLMYIN